MYLAQSANGDTLRKGENRTTGEKPFGARKRTNNKLNPHIRSIAKTLLS